MMKARSKNRRIFRRKIDLNICSIQESNGISKEAMKFFANEDENLKEDIEYLMKVFQDAKEYGSILDVKKIDFDSIEGRLEEIRNGETANLFELQYREILLEKLPLLVKQGRIMSERYDVLCTNPPYMGNMPKKMTELVQLKYSITKYDLYSVFIEKGIQFLKENGYESMVTGESWMFLPSFEQMRQNFIFNYTLINMLHLGFGAFESGFGTTSFIWRKINCLSYYTRFIRVVNEKSNEDKKVCFLKCRNIPFINKKIDITLDLNQLKIISGIPIGYWMSPNLIKLFHKDKISKEVITKSGIVTGNNDMFIKYWFEISIHDITFNANSSTDINDIKWVPTHKGGGSRRYYGNHYYIMNIYDIWDNNKVSKSVRRGDRDFYFKEGLTWSTLSNKLAFRKSPSGFVYETKGSMCFIKNTECINYILGLFNSTLCSHIMSILSPTLDFNRSNIVKMPYIFNKKYFDTIHRLVEENVKISKTDWDSFETSWDFKRHPLLTYSAIKNNFKANKIETAYNNWKKFANEQFFKLKANEEELNRIFIEIYGLQDELTPEVEEKDITITKIVNEKSEEDKKNPYVIDKQEVIKSFISYGVGCMFGRYSLDEEGLIYAGGEFDLGRYKTFIPTKDNVLMITDEDYFEDDTVHCFVEFVKVTFGEETLEENLDYIAEVLGQKSNETSRQTIRRYFLKDFYKDHVKKYQKRPIYWLFDSGKKDGFKALIYMHRYDSFTVARVRTDYLHKLQKIYESEVDRLDILINSETSAREKASVKKKKDAIIKQIGECKTYDQIISHVANQKIEMDLDDGVKVNYAKFQGEEVSQGEGKKLLKANLLSKL